MRLNVLISYRVDRLCEHNPTSVKQALESKSANRFDVSPPPPILNLTFSENNFRPFWNANLARLFLSEPRHLNKACQRENLNNSHGLSRKRIELDGKVNGLLAECKSSAMQINSEKHKNSPL